MNATRKTIMFQSAIPWKLLIRFLMLKSETCLKLSLPELIQKLFSDF